VGSRGGLTSSRVPTFAVRQSFRSGTRGRARGARAAPICPWRCSSALTRGKCAATL
jgi:hypothetical protein